MEAVIESGGGRVSVEAVIESGGRRWTAAQ